MNNILTLKNNKSPHVEINHYPDGQANVKVDLQYFDAKTPINIECRIKNFSELEVLLCIVAALMKNDRVINSLEFVYLFGQRSDRAFEIGQPNYFKDILAPILTRLVKDNHIYESSILFPHGTLATRYLGADSEEDEIMIIPYLLQMPHPIIIFGDKSAAIKFHSYDLRGQGFYYFDKTRDSQGQLTISMDSAKAASFHRDIDHFSRDLPILIFDDMCDGGMTFIKEGQWLKDKYPNKKLHLFVAHGIFSNGFDELFKYYDKIITTNSYQDFPQNKDDPFHIDPEMLQVIKVI